MPLTTTKIHALVSEVSAALTRTIDTCETKRESRCEKCTASEISKFCAATYCTASDISAGTCGVCIGGS